MSLSEVSDTLRSIVKIALLSRRPDRAPVHHRGGRIIVMGNGPSLNDAIANHADVIASTPSMAVNFAALSPALSRLRPEYYVLADPHFFKDADGPDDNRSKLRDAMNAVSWPMRLFVPVKYRKRAAALYGGPMVTVRGFNAVGAEGFDCIIHRAYAAGLAMPRPRNVLIAAIMLAVGEGFDELVVLGADHSWMKTLAVTDDNEVVSVQPHFYAESAHEEARVRHEYRGYRLHDIVGSFAVAFRSYHQIERYARRRGVRIINATPGSFIDAFERGTL